MDSKAKQAVIFGPGAIGSAVGALLVRGGWKAGFVGRTGPMDHSFRFRVGEDPAEGPYVFAKDQVALSEVALVIVAVKAFDLDKALAVIRDECPGGASVIPFANGWVYPLIKAAWALRPDLIWRLGFGTFGVSAPEVDLYQMRTKGKGRLVFGPLEDSADRTRAEEDLLSVSPVFSWDDSVRDAAQVKWLYNTVINSLAAAHRAPKNGDLLRDQASLRAVFQEAFHLGRQQIGPWKGSESELYDGLLALISDTAENENSMARDVRLGRQTESPWLAGMADPNVHPRLARLHETITGD